MDYTKLLNMPSDLAIAIIHKLNNEELKECRDVLEALKDDDIEKEN